MNIVVPRLFVDMDGTLAAFRKVTVLEELYECGYFSGLRPQDQLRAAAVQVMQEAARRSNAEIEI